MKRGAIFRKAKDASIKLKEGERVFIRMNGHYQEIGVVEPGGILPLIHMNQQL